MAHNSTSISTPVRDTKPGPSAITLARLRQFARAYMPVTPAPVMGGIILN